MQSGHGMQVSQLLDATFVSAMMGAGASDTTQHEVTAIRPDGSSVDLLVSMAPILLSGSGDAGSLCMMSDVSGLRQAEQ